MAKEPSAIEKPICAVLDMIFNVVMALLYGKHPSETKAQRATRWLVLLVVIVGIAVVYLVIKTIF